MDKEFDRSVCFSYFYSYLKQIEQIEEQFGPEKAHEVNMAIIRYGLFEEEITDPYLKILVGNTTIDMIDSSQSRRARGFSRKDDAKTKAVTDYYRDHPNASQNEIAKATGVSKGKVNKTLKEIRENGGVQPVEEDETSGHFNNSNSNININSSSNSNSNINSIDRDRRDRDRSTDITETFADALKVADAPEKKSSIIERNQKNKAQYELDSSIIRSWGEFDTGETSYLKKKRIASEHSVDIKYVDDLTKKHKELGLHAKEMWKYEAVHLKDKNGNMSIYTVDDIELIGIQGATKEQMKQYVLDAYVTYTEKENLDSQEIIDILYSKYNIDLSEELITC